MMARFVRWLRIKKLQAEIADLERDLRMIRTLREHDNKVEAAILDAMQRTKIALYHAQRKGTL